MFSVAIRESVSCPNCYVKSSSRCFYDPLTQFNQMQVGLHVVNATGYAAT